MLEVLSTKILSEVRVLPTVVKMTQYLEKQENNLKWYSDLFYTDKDYRICLRVSPGGVGKGKGTRV